LPLEDGPERAFAWLAPIPHSWDSRVTVQNVQQVVLRAGEDVQNVMIAYPQLNLQTGKNVMVLDIDHHLDFVLPVLPDAKQIPSWVGRAHDEVFQTFEGALNLEYFKELQ
jgi:hypothetical protein